jgi:hypothetical protein
MERSEAERNPGAASLLNRRSRISLTLHPGYGAFYPATVLHLLASCSAPRSDSAKIV